MFTDVRSKRIVFVAHCVLNQNAISDGTADYAGADVAVVRRLLEADVGIVQLPCPELNCLGLDRGDPKGAERLLIEENTRIRGAMELAAPTRILASLVEHAVFQAQEYHRHGFKVLGVVGINRSPSCGVDTTSIACKEAEGRGIFMEALHAEFERRGLEVEWVGIKASQPEDAAIRIDSLLSRPINRIAENPPE